MNLSNHAKVFISLFITIFLLFSLELLFRQLNIPFKLGITNMKGMFESGVFMRDRLLLWRFTPGKSYDKISPHYKGILRINSMGFREREIMKDKKTGIYRIFCVGGSNTCGEGVFESERFSNILERKLKEAFKSPSFEVYNFGMPAYSTLQILRLLKNELLDFNPDLIIVSPEQADGLALSNETPLPDSEIKILPEPIFKLAGFLERRSFIYRFVRNFSLNMFWKFKDKAGTTRKHYFVRVPPYDRIINLNTMADICHKNSIEIVYMDTLAVSNGKVSNIDADYNLHPNISITSLFKDGVQRNLFLDEGHINAKGHALVADAIFKYLEILFTEKNINIQKI